MSLVRQQFDVCEGVQFDCWAFVVGNEIYLKLKELAKLLNYSNEKMEYKFIDEDLKFTWDQLKDKVRPSKNHLETPSNWHPQTLFVSEPGVYALMARSNKPEAKRFVRYVYETILPTIRRTGYAAILDECFRAAQFHLIDRTHTRGYVYLASNDLLVGLDIYKIGSTCDLDARMAQLNTASPYDWKVLFAFETEDRLTVERDVQRHLSTDRLKREFFKFTGGSANAMDKVKKYFADVAPSSSLKTSTHEQME